MDNAKSKAYPLAPSELEPKILSLVQSAVKIGQLKRGANEGKAAIVILAADAEPIEIVLHLPLVCEDKNCVYVFVSSKTALGRACGVSRSVVACAIIDIDRSPINNEITAIRNAIDQIPL